MCSFEMRRSQFLKSLLPSLQKKFSRPLPSMLASTATQVTKEWDATEGYHLVLRHAARKDSVRKSEKE